MDKKVDHDKIITKSGNLVNTGVNPCIHQPRWF